MIWTRNLFSDEDLFFKYLELFYFCFDSSGDPNA